MKTFKSFFLLLFASALVLSVNSCEGGNDEQLEWFQLSDFESYFKPAWEGAGGKDAQTLDIRSESEYNAGHIPGAVSFPATAQNTENNNSALPEFVKQNFDSSKPIFICGGSNAQMTMVTCGRISKIGFTQTMGLDGGFNAWKNGDGPVE